MNRYRYGSNLFAAPYRTTLSLSVRPCGRARGECGGGEGEATRGEEGQKPAPGRYAATLLRRKGSFTCHPIFIATSLKSDLEFSRKHRVCYFLRSSFYLRMSSAKTPGWPTGWLDF